MSKRHLAVWCVVCGLALWGTRSLAQGPVESQNTELVNRGIVLEDFYDDIDTISDLPTEDREGSPVRPERVAICHKGVTILVSQAAVPAHRAHGDTVGPCGPEQTAYTIVCHKGETLVVPLSEAVGYLRRGAKLGSCDGDASVIMCNGNKNVAVKQSEVEAYTKKGFRPGPCQGTEAIVMCHKGRTIVVRREHVDALLKVGASVGSCK